MTDPATLTTAGIVSLAYHVFLKTSVKKLADSFTDEAISLMGKLRQIISERLYEKHEMAKDALSKAEIGDEIAIKTVGTLLDVEMLDKDFAAQIQAIVQKINMGKILSQDPMIQNNYDNAKGYQITVKGGYNNIGENHFRDQDKWN